MIKLPGTAAFRLTVVLGLFTARGIFAQQNYSLPDDYYLDQDSSSVPFVVLGEYCTWTRVGNHHYLGAAHCIILSDIMSNSNVRKLWEKFEPGSTFRFWVNPYTHTQMEFRLTIKSTQYSHFSYEDKELPEFDYEDVAMIITNEFVPTDIVPIVPLGFDPVEVDQTLLVLSRFKRGTKLFTRDDAGPFRMGTKIVHSINERFIGVDAIQYLSQDNQSFLRRHLRKPDMVYRRLAYFLANKKPYLSKRQFDLGPGDSGAPIFAPVNLESISEKDKHLGLRMVGIHTGSTYIGGDYQFVRIDRDNRSGIARKIQLWLQMLPDQIGTPNICIPLCQD